MAKDSCRTERLIIDQGFIEEENGQNIITITNQSNLDEFSKSPKQDSHQINTDIQQIKPNKVSIQEIPINTPKYQVLYIYIGKLTRNKTPADRSDRG